MSHAEGEQEPASREQLALPLSESDPKAGVGSSDAGGADDESSSPAASAGGWLARARMFLNRHGRKLWWLHSLYALGLGLLIVLFANKGFAYSRVLIVTLGVAYVLLLVFFRVFGTGRAQEAKLGSTKDKLKFFVMTYVLKNLYQGMLFFVLPFYWKAATFDSSNKWFVLLLCVCAFLSTMDVVFDQFLMRFRGVASVFYAFTLFACLNLVIPALLPDTATLTTMSIAAGLTVVAFWSMHVPMAELRKPMVLVALALSVGMGVSIVSVARPFVPPVPMHLSRAAVGPKLLDDGRLAYEVNAVHRSHVKRLHAVTDVVVPGGVGDRLYHVWRKDDEPVGVMSGRTKRRVRQKGLVRLRSKLSSKHIPKQRTGEWSVDVVTADGQLVGRFAFDVIE